MTIAERSPGYVECDEETISEVLEAAIAVHRELGPGLLESVYRKALSIGLEERGIDADEEVEVRGKYRGQALGLAFRADIVVQGRLVLELKAVRAMDGGDYAQLRTYLRFLGLRYGLLLNFGCSLMKQGMRRVDLAVEGGKGGRAAGALRATAGSGRGRTHGDGKRGMEALRRGFAARARS